MANRSSSSESQDFCSRLRHLVDTYDGRNVTAAARRLGIPQRTLAKVYAGSTAEPRLKLIQALVAQYPMVDARWIVLGETASSVRRFDAAARARAIALLREMLSELAERPEVASSLSLGANVASGNLPATVATTGK